MCSKLDLNVVCVFVMVVDEGSFVGVVCMFVLLGFNVSCYVV